MYLNRWVLLLACIAGIAGGAALVDAFLEYRANVRAYTEVEVAYVPGSAVFGDATGTSVMADIDIINRSPATVTIEFLELRLYADGTFAGATYADWQPIQIATGASDRHRAELEIAISQMREQVGEAELALRGEIRMRYAGIERPLTRPIRLEIGRVDAAGQGD